MAEKAIRKVARQQEDAITFTRKDAQTLNFSHNKPLFKRALVDSGSSVNIMPWQTFKAAGIPESKLTVQATPLVTFASNTCVTKGHMVVDLQIGPIRASTKFHVIEAYVSYHLLLGRPCIHHNYVVPSTLHQCLKAIKGRKKVMIPATRAPFSQEEVHWIEAVFFDEVADTIEETRPRGVSLNEGASEERSSPVNCQMEIDLVDDEEPIVKRIKLPDGRIAYKL
ncbi:LOW QUALITY PROTEIN: Aspartic peptidase domain containing protein [Trema orientale]|uniref:Aspartic peptidase domain containing protein n=1 Tax=Trema orientale TaxID=63057 RepID=A0A2P5CJK6_TREOI|nr:LOW QUALITY PROTEIN: Aspartic peptidase domain containing protein [Trema orientale]